MISETYISPSTSIGANLVAESGAAFRVWAPLATVVCLNGTLGDVVRTG